MGGSSKSKTITNVEQTDKRIGAAEGSIVAGEGSELTVSAADAAVIAAALKGVKEFAALDSDADTALVEQVLAQSGEGLRNTTILAGVGIAAAVAFMVFGRR